MGLLECFTVFTRNRLWLSDVEVSVELHSKLGPPSCHAICLVPMNCIIESLDLILWQQRFLAPATFHLSTGQVDLECRLDSYLAIKGLSWHLNSDWRRKEGKSDSPTKEEIDKLHTKFTVALRELFNQHKHKMGSPLGQTTESSLFRDREASHSPRFEEERLTVSSKIIDGW
jgi:hypothetical protein